MTLIPMPERYQRPDWVRRINAMAGSAGGAARMVPLVADHLIDHTRVSTGITDAGDLGDGAELADHLDRFGVELEP